MTRRSVLVTAAALALPRAAFGSTLAIARQLRQMVGYQVAAADDLQRVYRAESIGRIFHLRTSGLFLQRGAAGTLAPITSSDAIVFAKRSTPQRPGLPERAQFEYRLLIDGAFYHVEAFD